MTYGNIVDQYQNIIPIAAKLYEKTSALARVALLPLFLLSIAFAYTKDYGLKGAVFLRVRYLVITVFLLLNFAGFASFIRLGGQQLAASIDDMQGFDLILKAAHDKAINNEGVLNLVGMGLAGLSVALSYGILYCMQVILIAFYHFYWSFLFVTGPFFILGALFERTMGLARNMFRALILVSAWPVVWAILSAFLKGIPFADAYSIPGNYFTVFSLNIVVSIAMLLSPFILSYIVMGVGGGGGDREDSGPVLMRHLGRFGVNEIGKRVIKGAVSLGTGSVSGLKKTVESKMAARRPPRPEGGGGGKIASVAFFLLFVSQLFADTINVLPGHSCLICLHPVASNPIQNVVLGSAKYFDITRSTSNLILSNLKTGQSTSLDLIYKNNVVTHEITSDPQLPPQEKFGCKEFTKNTPLRTLPKINFVAKEKPSLTMKVSQFQWSNRMRDYLSVLLELENNESGPLSLDWPSLVLYQEGSIIHFSKIRAMRRSLPSEASMRIAVEFTKPSLSYNKDAFIRINTNKGILSAPLVREDL